jgi:hypothetical protein
MFGVNCENHVELWENFMRFYEIVVDDSFISHGEGDLEVK